MKNLIHITIFFLLVIGAKIFAQDAPALLFQFPTHNNLMYNKFLLNPTFSNQEIPMNYFSLYHRNQWIEFDDSQKVYLATYNKTVNEKAGVGFGIFQHKNGVLSSWGGIANYSYNVSLSEKMSLVLGFNLAYYNTGISKTDVIVEESDPYINAVRNNSILSLKPGISFRYSSFDIGVYAENYIDYDFKTSKSANKYASKALIGHLFYKINNEKEGWFGNNILTFGIRGNKTEEKEFAYNGLVLIEFPKMGWLQTTIDKQYGFSGGIGFHLSKKLSLGYVYERGLSNGLNNFGPTHEINLTLHLNDRAEIKSVFTSNKKSKKVVKTEEEVEDIENIIVATDIIESDSDNEATEKTKTSTKKKSTKTSQANVKKKNEKKPTIRYKTETIKKIDIEDLKKQIDKEYWPLFEMLNINQGDDAEILNEKVQNLLDYVSRLKQTKNQFNDNSTEEEKNKKIMTQVLQNHPKEIDKAIKETLKCKDIETKSSPEFGNFMKIKEMEKGIYIIANVFSDKKNTINFLEDLKNRGITGDYFTNPENNLMYVYLKKYENWYDALNAYYTNINNTYFEAIWILQINMN